MQMRRIETTVLSGLRFQSTARQYSPGSMARRRCRLSGFARHNPGNQCRPKPCTIQLLVEIDGLSEENPSCYTALFGRPRYRCKTTPSLCGLLDIRLHSIDLLRPNLYFSTIFNRQKGKTQDKKVGSGDDAEPERFRCAFRGRSRAPDGISDIRRTGLGSVRRSHRRNNGIGKLGIGAGKPPFSSTREIAVLPKLVSGAAPGNTIFTSIPKGRVLAQEIP